MLLMLLESTEGGPLVLVNSAGQKRSFGKGHHPIEVFLKSEMVLDSIISRGDLGLAEEYIAGNMEVSDWPRLFEWVCRNEEALTSAWYGKWISLFWDRIQHFLNRNTKTQAKKNIQAHYDLGNNFYKLWLDPSMTYSSGIYENPTVTLEQAQQKKYDHLIEIANIQEGEKVLEIGCGWGGFISRVVQTKKCFVTAVTISTEQFQFVQERIKKENIEKFVDIKLLDYRDIKGKFDRVVSIEMIEAVGIEYWNQFFAKISETLKSTGSAVVQGITIRQDRFARYIKEPDFIRKYIFPGSALLTENAVVENCQNNGLRLEKKIMFGKSYARTLKDWRESFEQKLAEVKMQGFDDKFERLWRLYLAYCEGAFAAERINVGQFLILPEPRS